MYTYMNVCIVNCLHFFTYYLSMRIVCQYKNTICLYRPYTPDETGSVAHTMTVYQFLDDMFTI